MTQQIHIMSPTLASQVAAGEVVERPASVVKELVENSLDAGSHAIRVEIRRGGSGLIKVVDDGCGMSLEDAKLCTKRHATSKLHSVEDLFCITQMGFRGEALPSIASVARLKLSTRQTNALEGWEIRIDGGVELEPKSSGVSPGTSIEVTDLFFNTPARRKFMKSTETEAAHIEHQLRLHALSFPKVRFTFIKDGQIIFDLPATSDLRTRISSLTDTTTALALIPITTTNGPGISVSGYLLPLSEARRSRKGQFIFMNKRPVEDSLINRAVRDGFGGFPTGLHPALYLYMEVEPALVDVNVHPSKKEVRFRRPGDVVETIVEAISSTLRNHARRDPGFIPTQVSVPNNLEPSGFDVDVCPVSQNPTTQGTPKIISPVSRNEPVVTKSPAATSASAATNQPPFQLQSLKIHPLPPTQGQLKLHELQNLGENHHLPQQPPPSSSHGKFTYIGLLRKQFPLFETEEGLVIMNTKAARERIIYERLRETHQGTIPSQRLLDPVLIDLEPRDFSIIRQFSVLMEQSGLSITPFGTNTIRLEALPAFLNIDDAKSFLLDLIDRLTQSEFSRNPHHMPYDNFIKELAKKSATREHFFPQHVERLMKELLGCEVPYCTPFGKPTLINYSIPEIKRKFGVSE